VTSAEDSQHAEEGTHRAGCDEPKTAPPRVRAPGRSRSGKTSRSPRRRTTPPLAFSNAPLERAPSLPPAWARLGRNATPPPKRLPHTEEGPALGPWRHAFSKGRHQGSPLPLSAGFRQAAQRTAAPSTSCCAVLGGRPAKPGSTPFEAGPGAGRTASVSASDTSAAALARASSRVRTRPAPCCSPFGSPAGRSPAFHNLDTAGP